MEHDLSKGAEDIDLEADRTGQEVRKVGKSHQSTSFAKRDEEDQKSQAMYCFV
jgi:hypothetical protein